MKLKYSEFAEEYAYEHIYTIIFKVGGCGYRYYVEMCAELIDDFNKYCKRIQRPSLFRKAFCYSSPEENYS